MNKRYLYSLLIGLPGFFVALIITFMIVAAAAGFLWVAVYGDNPWPDFAKTVLGTIAVITFLTTWSALIIGGFNIGKKLEKAPDSSHGLNKNHILISVGATALTILFVVLYQLRVGNIGPKSDSLQCSEFCIARGYSVSELAPRESGARLCRCLGNGGQVVAEFNASSDEVWH